MTLQELQPQVDTLAAYEAFEQNGKVAQASAYYDEEVAAVFGAEQLVFFSDLAQTSGSYKVRGVQTYLDRNVSDPDIEIVTNSAGNHGAAVAERAGRSAIFLPENTPRQKIVNVLRLGNDRTRVELVGQTVDEAGEAAREYVESQNGDAQYIHPFDDPDVVSGQGTLGHELMRVDDFDVVVVPVGGGGLLTGMMHAFERSGKHDTHFVAVEPSGAPSLAHNLQFPNRPLNAIDSFVDGAAVKKVGTHVVQALLSVDRSSYSVVHATRQEAREAVSFFWENYPGIKPELAGALSLAGLHKVIDLLEGKKVACMLTGRNLSRERYSTQIRASAYYRPKPLESFAI